MTVYEKMKSGQLYFATDETLMSVQAECLELQYEYDYINKKIADCDLS